MISGQTALIIAGVGAAIIVIYMFYLVLRLNCRLDAKAQGGTCSMASDEPQESQLEAKPPVEAPEECVMEEEKPTCAVCNKEEKHLAATCKPGVYTDFAGILVQRLMESAKKVTQDRGMDQKYYHYLLRTIYDKFYKLNASIVNQKELEQSRKFLEEIKKEVHSYQVQLQSEPSAEEEAKQSGGSMSLGQKDVSKIINENEYAIYEVYPSLAN